MGLSFQTSRFDCKLTLGFKNESVTVLYSLFSISRGVSPNIINKKNKTKLINLNFETKSMQEFLLMLLRDAARLINLNFETKSESCVAVGPCYIVCSINSFDQYMNCRIIFLYMLIRLLILHNQPFCVINNSENKY